MGNGGGGLLQSGPLGVATFVLLYTWGGALLVWLLIRRRLHRPAYPAVVGLLTAIVTALAGILTGINFGYLRAGLSIEGVGKVPSFLLPVFMTVLMGGLMYLTARRSER